MKLKMFTFCFALINSISSVTFASDRCEENELTEMARIVDVSGTSVFKRGKVTEETSVEKFYPGSQVYADLERWAISDNLELLSQVFGVEDTEVMALARDKASCQIVLYGTDGESISQGKLKDLSVSSIQYEIEGQLYSISKVKKD